MSWRTIVVANSAKMDYQLGYLVVRTDKVTKIHLTEISLVIIESTAVSITVALLSELMKKKIKVVFCDEKNRLNGIKKRNLLYGQKLLLKRYENRQICYGYFIKKKQIN